MHLMEDEITFSWKKKKKHIDGIYFEKEKESSMLILYSYIEMELKSSIKAYYFPTILPAATCDTKSDDDLVDNKFNVHISLVTIMH